MSDQDFSEATRLGSVLGLFARYGRDNVLNAIAHCNQGTATPEQQQMCAAMVNALTP